MSEQFTRFFNNPTTIFIIQLASFISAITTICGAIIWITKAGAKLRGLRNMKWIEYIAGFVVSIYASLAVLDILLVFNHFSLNVVIISLIVIVAITHIIIASGQHKLKDALINFLILPVFIGIVCSSVLVGLGAMVWLDSIHSPDGIQLIACLVIFGILFFLQGLAIFRLSDAAGWIKI